MDKKKYLDIRKQHLLKVAQYAWLVPFGINVILISMILTVWWSQKNQWIPLWVASLLTAVFIPVLIFRMFALMHESVHGVGAENTTVNDYLGIISGAFCFLPFELWKKSHVEHHFWSGNVEKDPVMAFLLTYYNMKRLRRNIINALWSVWFPILGLIQHTVFWKLSMMHFLQSLRSRQMDMKSLLSFLSPIILWGSIFTFAPATVIFFGFLPAFYLYLLLVEMVNLPHHLRLPANSGDKRQNLWDQHESVRTCVYPKWFSHWVTLNFNYHVEHHLYPDAPWFLLDQLHEQVQPVLGSAYNTDLNMSWIVQQRKMPLDQVLEINNQSYQQPRAA